MAPDEETVTPGTVPRPGWLVLLCTHDGSAYLSEQLASLARQTRLPSRIVVHDWGSRDATRDLLAQFAQAQRGRLEVELHWHDEVPGAGASYLRALADLVSDDSGDHDWIAPCDQDDVWSERKLQLLDEAVRRDPGLDLVHCDIALVDAGGRRIADCDLQPGGRFGRPPDLSHPATLFVNTVAGMSLGVSRRFLVHHATAWQAGSWVMHDWAICIVAHLAAARTAFVAESLVAYRQHGGNLVGALDGDRWHGRRWPAIWAGIQARVRAVAIQYQGAAAWAANEGLPLPLGTRAPDRWQVARCVLSGPSLPLMSRLRVAAGLVATWRRDAAAD